jgi:prophage regulatory protein
MSNFTHEESTMMDGSIFRLADVMHYLSLSRSAIYDRQNPDSPRYDSTFPKKIFLGGGAVGWQKEDIDAWLVICKERGKVTPKKQDSSKLSTDNIRAPSTRKQLSPKTNPSQKTAPQNLAGLITKGLIQNENIITYLKMSVWTPTMGALLISGIKAPIDCTEIPLSGNGLDNQDVIQFDERFHNARQILRLWNHQNNPPLTISPIEFFIWCDEESIETEWLRLFRELAGCPTPGSADIAASKLALL